MGEAANENRSGGHFTQAIINTSNEWASSGTSSPLILNTRDAFNYACRELQELTTRQNPEYCPGRRINHFPFAINIAAIHY